MMENGTHRPARLLAALLIGLFIAACSWQEPTIPGPDTDPDDPNDQEPAPQILWAPGEPPVLLG
jgi:hypothetical protein